LLVKSLFAKLFSRLRKEKSSALSSHPCWKFRSDKNTRKNRGFMPLQAWRATCEWARLTRSHVTLFGQAFTWKL